MTRPLWLQEAFSLARFHCLVFTAADWWIPGAEKKNEKKKFAMPHRRTSTKGEGNMFKVYSWFSILMDNLASLWFYFFRAITTVFDYN